MVTNTRQIQDYECENNPNLILIAARPLKADVSCIFDSMPGMQYLSTIFKSKFNYLNTYVTYIDDSTFFMKEYFYNILKIYNLKNTLNVNTLAIGFVGQEAFDIFANRVSDTNYSSVIGTIKIKDAYLQMNCQSFRDELHNFSVFIFLLLKLPICIFETSGSVPTWKYLFREP